MFSKLAVFLNVVTEDDSSESWYGCDQEKVPSWVFASSPQEGTFSDCVRVCWQYSHRSSHTLMRMTALDGWNADS